MSNNKDNFYTDEFLEQLFSNVPSEKNGTTDKRPEFFTGEFLESLWNNNNKEDNN